MNEFNNTYNDSTDSVGDRDNVGSIWTLRRERMVQQAFAAE